MILWWTTPDDRLENVCRDTKFWARLFVGASQCLYPEEWRTQSQQFFVMRSASKTVPELGSFHKHDDDKVLLISCARLKRQVRSFLNPIRYLQKPPPANQVFNRPALWHDVSTFYEYIVTSAFRSSPLHMTKERIGLSRPPGNQLEPEESVRGISHHHHHRLCYQST